MSGGGWIIERAAARPGGKGVLKRGQFFLTAETDGESSKHLECGFKRGWRFWIFSRGIGRFVVFGEGRCGCTSIDGKEEDL